MRSSRATLNTALLACLLVALAAVGASAQVPVAILAPPRLRQGDPLLAWILTEAPVTEAPVTEAPAPEAKLVSAAGRVLARARCFAASAVLGADSTSAMVGADRGLFGALIAIAPEFSPGAYKLVVGAATASVTVDPRSFPLETVRLNPANAKIRSKPSGRKNDEAHRLYDIISTVDDAAVFAEPSTFVFPVEGGSRSSGFGDVRRYVYGNGKSNRTVHAGIDWAVVAGTVVRACARGKVLMASDREVTGKTLVIEHLPGLYSLYFHLSKIEVEEGAVVDRGSRIALSGSTGMATGPHLHWELRARGEAVDPEYWLKAALLDKTGVTAIINGLIEGR
jgi:murein DD-endopeptidase MepM/ murein hydrolase activator NlpD